MIEQAVKRVNIFKASAGSGKTFTLVLEYLTIVVRNPAAYRNVLAITFTNKAAAEMKHRIIGGLRSLASGGASAFLGPLAASTGLSEPVIRQKAAQALSSILHDYGNFSVSTIDSFTHKLIRSFARDLDLPGRFDIELDTKVLIGRITDQLMNSIGKDEYITQVLTQYVEEKVQKENSWNIEGEIRRTAEHLFQETSRDPVSELAGLGEENFPGFISYVREIRDEYITGIRNHASRALALTEAAGLSENDFAGKSKSVISVLRQLLSEHSPKEYTDIFEKDSLKKAVNDDRWTSGNTADPAVQALVNGGLRSELQQMVQYHAAQFVRFATAFYAYQHIHSLAVLRQIEDLLEAHKERHKVIHISDFHRKISDFLRREPPDYLYWRLGERYRYYLLDEFQDTSLVQWKNLLPLLEYLYADDTTPGSLLLVGDSKQAIYRWRGGAVELLEKTAPAALNAQPQTLPVNYRSHEIIVEFNNLIFRNLAAIFSDHELAPEIYSTAEQKTDPRNAGSGLVEVSVLKGERSAFRKNALEKCADTVRKLLQENFRQKDIAVLVRTGDEGSEVATVLSEAGFKVISSDSLRVDSCPPVTFLVSLLHYLADPSHAFARAEVVHYYFLSVEKWTSPWEKIRELLEKGTTVKQLDEHLPAEFRKLRFRQDMIPLYEMCEELIRIFKLGEAAPAYIQHFLEVVLEFSAKQKPEIRAFLEYWEEHSNKFTLAVPEGEDAVRIMTIHKSKGLEFPVTLLPFVNWSIRPKPDATFWARSEGAMAEYGDTFLVPLNIQLEQSNFRSDFRKEVSRTLLDNLNVLYVAFTRAAERMYIFIPEHKSKNIGQPAAEDIKTAGDLVHGALYEEMKEMPVPDVYVQGIPVPHESEAPAEVAEPPVFHTAPWRGRIRVERKFSRYWDKIQSSGKNEIPSHTLVAEALRRIRQPEDAIRILTDLRESGLMETGREAEITERVKQLLTHPSLSAWFTGTTATYSVPEIISSDGEVLRPHRWTRKGANHSCLWFTTAEEAESLRETANKISSSWMENHTQPLNVYLFLMDEEKLEPLPV